MNLVGDCDWLAAVTRTERIVEDTEIRHKERERDQPSQEHRSLLNCCSLLFRAFVVA